MSVIDILGEQEETLGTAEDLTEEIVVEVMQPELSGSFIQIEFETSLGLCRGSYLAGELGHEEVNMEDESAEKLRKIFASYNGVFIHQINREWVEISLEESLTIIPEYKIFSRIVTGPAS
jgi:hypothetical protein